MSDHSSLPPRPDISHDDDEEHTSVIAATIVAMPLNDATTNQGESESKNDEDQNTNNKQEPQQQRRRVNTELLGNLVHQTVVANLPAGQRPIPEWKRKILEREALARGETLPPPPEGQELYKPPHQRIPPAPLVSQQAQERSAFPGDFWFHKEIESLISKHRRKVHIKQNEEDAFYDRGGKAGRGVIASYVVDGFPLIRNARPKHARENQNVGMDGEGGENGEQQLLQITRPGFGNQQQQADSPAPQEERRNAAAGGVMNDEDDDDDFSPETPHEVEIGGKADE